VRRVLVAGILAALALVAAGPAGASLTHRATPQQPVRVALFGDSIGHQAEPYFDLLLGLTGAAQTQSYTFQGATICGWLPKMSEVASTYRPDAVVIESVGNTGTPCAEVGAPGSPQSLAAIGAATTQAARLFLSAGASHVYLVPRPVTQFRWMNEYASQIDAVYRQVAVALGVRVSVLDAGLAVARPDGGYTRTLPCMPAEISATPSLCTGGLQGGVPSNVVREADGIHFCPVSWPPGFAPPGCPTYSSGAFRFAAAMVMPILQSWGLGSPPSQRGP